ncbi:MAG TPA: bidirectional hydrogenase complex protein HoxU [Phototrophicaceae bacterium]|nr:bidirectional hydrogenase complex protein HoxU [Phototrophicaceae bacterium]
MTRVLTLKINDQEISGREDETILEVARENNIPIPTLCQLEGLSNVGACRLCLVEVKGIAKLLPACTTRVAEGMEVLTDSERLQKYRRMTVELLFAEGNHICSVCVANGHCELQNLAVALGIDHIHLPYLNPRRSVDASHERFAIDHNRCVLCTRCVRVCAEIEGAHTWDVMGRGYQSCVITDLHQPWGASTSCTSCGKCVQVCPTGALFSKGKAVGEMTKHKGFLVTLAEMRENEK